MEFLHPLAPTHIVKDLFASRPTANMWHKTLLSVTIYIAETHDIHYLNKILLVDLLLLKNHLKKFVTL